MVQVRNVIAGILLLSALLLLFGCSSPKNLSDDVNDGGAGEVIDVSDKRGVDDSDTVTTTNATVSTKDELHNNTCVAEWICLSAKTKIYREGNCSFTLRQDCKFGCKNNTCGVAPVCTSGWNCDGNFYRGYRLESCEFEKKEKCEFGCDSGECLKEVVKNTTVVAEPVVEQKVVSSTMLNLGEIIVVKNHNVSIYAIDSEQVMLNVDGKKSKFLKQGEIFTRGDLSIVVEEILFQSYNNGKKMISYSVK